MNGKGPYVKLRSGTNFPNLLLAHLGSILLAPCLQGDHGKDQQPMKHDIFNGSPPQNVEFIGFLYIQDVLGLSITIL